MAALPAGRDPAAFLDGLPGLEQTAVPIHPSRRARLLAPLPDRPLGMVALHWRGDSVAVRRRNAALLRDTAATLPPDLPLRVRVHDEVALLPTGDGAVCWALSENLGTTLEDRLRSGALRERERADVVETLAALHTAMLARGALWQGFAPRNMFLGAGTLSLIDFEEVVDPVAEPIRAAEVRCWYRVFFADCLTPDEAALLFGNECAAPPIGEHEALPADPFEHALLGEDVVTWSQRRDLLERSAELEGRHDRPDGGVLFGHELGHFWGDFVDPAVEGQIFRSLTLPAPPESRAACLEALEAAMEADVGRMLRLEALGGHDGRAPRTEALADVLDGAGPESVARWRMAMAMASWYQRLEDDPDALVDELVFDLATDRGLPHAEKVDLLLGAGTDRAAHEASLRRTVAVGLDFMYRSDRGEPFLHHAGPDELRHAVGGPLPKRGTGFDRLLAEVADPIVEYSIAQSHGSYLAFPDSGNAVAAVAGSMLGRLLNQNLIALDRSAPAATFVEIQVIEWAP